jgi:hypothetical protein
MKLSPFISGVFGTLGLALSFLAGIASGNSIESILYHGLLCAAICYVVGYCVGLVAQQVALEHARHVSKIVAQQDAKDEAQRLQEEADRRVQAAANGEVPVAPLQSAAPASR